MLRQIALYCMVLRDIGYCVVLNRVAWYTCKSIVSVCRVCCQIGPTFNDYKNNSGCEAIFSKHEQRITSFPLAGRPLQKSGTFACIVQNCFSMQMVIISSLQLCSRSLRQLASNRLDGTDMGSWLSFFHIPNDRRICRIFGHHQKNVLILLQCIAMWEERKIHVVPISL